MVDPGGFDLLYRRVPELESAAVFAGSDWDAPGVLVPELAFRTLRFGDPVVTLVEILSEVRLLAVAQGDYVHPGIHGEHARHFLQQVMAMNLDLVTGELSEADRLRPGGLGPRVMALYRFLMDRLGSAHLVEQLAEEVWELLAQRPVRVESAEHMIGRIAICLADPSFASCDAAGRGARLAEALFTPSPGCRQDPGIDAYAQWLEGVARPALVEEATRMGAAMRETGVVSAYHPVLLRHLRDRHDDLLLTALGLSSTGCDALLSYSGLVYTLVDEVVHPETSQAVHGLAMLLERALLHAPGVAPALWRQLRTRPCEPVGERLRLAFGTHLPPHDHLMADLLAVLGQPLGVAQGNHPTCQSARAIAMWSLADPRRLLDLLNVAVRDDDVMIRFEGDDLSSRALLPGSTGDVPGDVDAVSLVLVPHLDRIYLEMGRRCAHRGGDPHRWVNPELHGEGVHRGFCIAVNPATGALEDLEEFLRTFYAAYHPYYNGQLPVVHPQPAGIAATDALGRFLGWHAISIQRLALDAAGVMRVYFYNPNNDSAQDWGQGIVTATYGHGEWPGESSLPVAEFAARLYVFHFDEGGLGDPAAVPAQEVSVITTLVRESWGARR